MVSRAKLYKLKLVPELKTNKSLNLLLVDTKANSSIFMRLEMVRMKKKKRNQKIKLVENQISCISQLLRKHESINLHEAKTKILNK